MLARTIHLLLVCFILLAPTPQVYGAEPIILRDGVESYLLGGAHLDILEDPGGTLTIDDIVSPEIAARFQPNRMHIPNFGITDAAFWFRFTLHGETFGKEKWLLLFDQPLTDRVDLYLPQADGTFQVLLSGEFTPISARPLPGKDILFPLPVTATAQTFYLRTWLPGRAQMPMTVLTEGAMRRIESRQVLTFGLYAGIIVCLSLVALFIYRLLRVRYYLHFAAYLFALFLTQIGLNGFLHLWIPAGVFASLLLFLWSWAVCIGLQFERSFLQTGIHIPRIDRILKWVMVGFSLLPVISFWSPLISTRLLNVCMPVVTLAVLTSAALVWRQGSRVAGYYLLARLSMYTVVLLFVLSNHGMLSLNLAQYPILVYGSLLHILFIVIAMSTRFGDMKTDLDVTLDRLQREVVEHTAANRALEAEMAERSRLEQEVVEISDKERQRMSHELHDGLCQQLTSARLYCNVFGKSMAAGDSDLSVFTKLKDVLDESVQHAYELSRGAWPLEHDVGSSAFEELVARLGERTGIRIELRQDLACDQCHCGQMGQIYRVAQEAIGNALKHSRGQLITVALKCTPAGGIALEVRDDGIGRHAGNRQADGGMGIRIMAHRARMMSGRLEIQDAAGGGTLVLCTVPVTRGES